MTIQPAGRGAVLALSSRELAALGLSPDRPDPAPILALLRQMGVNLPANLRVDTYSRPGGTLLFLRPAPRRPRHYGYIK